MSLPKPFETHTQDDLSHLADMLLKVRNNYYAAKDKAELLKEAVRSLEDEMIEAMTAMKLESVASRKATISLKRNQFVELYDDEKFFEYVRKKNAFDLVRKQPVLSACQARWEDQIDVPGCRPGTKVSLSVTQRAKK